MQFDKGLSVNNFRAGAERTEVTLCDQRGWAFNHEVPSALWNSWVLERDKYKHYSSISDINWDNHGETTVLIEKRATLSLLITTIIINDNAQEFYYY